ncbi:MAG: hypothetical protein IKW53_07760 [Clostridia bacterium]|nr:hypothetical protein [Clostridia bacterium]
MNDSPSHKNNATASRILSVLPAKMPATASASAPTPFFHSHGGYLGGILFVKCASI